MWVALISCVLAVGILGVWFGFVPPPHATTLIYFRDGELHVQRGRIQHHAREHVSDILREAGVLSAFIAITPGGWIAFSRRIPTGLHQRLRNVLLNQWA